MKNEKLKAGGWRVKILSLGVLAYLHIILLLFTACERRALEDEPGVTAMVTFTFDWSQSMLEQSEMQQASIWFFPHDGSPSFEWRMQGDLNKTIVPLVEGKYSIVVFNETVDESDWAHTIAFEGSERYETFNVYATKDEFKGLYSRANEADVRKTPEALAWWSLNEFEVTPDMIAYTRGASSRAANQEVISKSLQAVTDITPQPLTVVTKIVAQVQNLKSAVRCSAALSGATGKISLATGHPVPGGVTHIFIMNNRQYDPLHPLNGTIEANLLLFKFVEEDIKYELQLDFLLHDGTIRPPDIFNITDQIDKEKSVVEVNIGIKDDPSDPEPDHPIVLPEIIAPDDVLIDNWVNVDIPIN